jgi:multiple sugar transport system permease protein
MMLPGVVTLIPVYLIMRDLGWLNTVLPLIVPIYFGGGAFNIFLIRQFMLGIPRELEDAAQIDGASTGMVFFRIILPLVKPVLAVTAWFSALASWGDFLGPLIYLNVEHSWTFTLGLYEFPGMMPFGWGDQLEMAMAVISMAPVIIGFFFIQNWLIEGVNLSGIVR